MQHQRRTNPYPWTWEPAVAAVLSAVLVATLGVHLGRSLAVAAAGYGWHWVGTDQLFRSLPGILTGHPDAGLPTLTSGVQPVALAAWIATVELALLVAATIGGKRLWERWGSGRILGMATRDEAEQVLGVTRLHYVRRIVRPDLYPVRRPQRRPVPTRSGRSTP
jgi:hypothetical protein